MILFSLAGIAAQAAFGWTPAAVVGIGLGFLIAALMPARSSCPVDRTPEGAARRSDEHTQEPQA